VQALLVAQAADAIVGFLYRIHQQERETPPRVRLEYGDNSDFNSYIDDENSLVHIFALEYRPSEVLFAVDPEAYRDALEGYDSDEEKASDNKGGTPQ
jgi:hypothetical protein